MRSIQPVLHPQPRHLLEVHQISCEQGRVVFQCDAGDTEVQGADPNFPLWQAVKNIGGIWRPWQKKPLRQTRQRLLKIAIRANTPVHLPVRANLSKPAFESFLRRNHSQESIVFSRHEAISQTLTENAIGGELPAVIDIKNEHPNQPTIHDFRLPATTRRGPWPPGRIRCPSCARRSPSMPRALELEAPNEEPSRLRRHILRHPLWALNLSFSRLKGNPNSPSCQGPFTPLNHCARTHP